MFIDNSVVLTDSVVKTDNKYYPQIFLEAISFL